MVGSPRLDFRLASILRKKKTKKKRIIVVGLKSHNSSREMLLRLLSLFVVPGDIVLAVHVQQSTDTFNPNSFHIHEDLCKSKQVEFQVRVCTGNPFKAVLTHQAVLHSATMLVVGCNSPRSRDSFISSCLKDLPRTCSLLVMDSGGRTILQMQGDSEYISPSQESRPSRLSSQSIYTSSIYRPDINHPSLKSVLKTSPRVSPNRHPEKVHNIQIQIQLPNIKLRKHVEKLARIESKGANRRFTPEELRISTDKFSSHLVIGKSSHSKVYKATLKDGQTVAVKVLTTSPDSGEELLQEVEMLSGLKHDNIVKLIGYCYSEDMHAVVYNLLDGSLKPKLTRLRWGERLKVAVGVAKALEYLHHCCSPPIIHRDVKSSNILLSNLHEPWLSDFGTAMVYRQPQQPVATTKPFHVVGTFGYLAPEYMMYGKVDEKIDVYSYGVVLLELITGKEAIQENKELKNESLVLWTRSLLSRGLCERLIDPNLYDDYNEEEMQRMIFAARLCLTHSSSRRPTISMILKLLDEPEYWVKMRRERDEFINKSALKGNYDWRIMSD